MASFLNRSWQCEKYLGGEGRECILHAQPLANKTTPSLPLSKATITTFNLPAVTGRSGHIHLQGKRGGQKKGGGRIGEEERGGGDDDGQRKKVPEPKETSCFSTQLGRKATKSSWEQVVYE